MYTNENASAKRAKLLFFIIKYANCVVEACGFV